MESVDVPTCAGDCVNMAADMLRTLARALDLLSADECRLSHVRSSTVCGRIVRH